MRFTIMIALAALTWGVVGCGDGKAPAASPQTITTSELPAEEKDKIALEATNKGERENRIQNVKNIWETFVKPAGKEESYGWLDEARGFSAEGIEACNLSGRFNSFTVVYAEAKNHSDEEEEIGLPSVETLRKQFVALTARYLKVFSEVAVKGSPVACRAKGEGGDESLPFNTEDFEMLLGVMKLNGIGPADVQMTPAKIRAVHLALFRRDIPDLKKRIDEEESSDASGYVYSVMEDWHYTAAELGLTKAEMAKINLPDEGRSEGDGK